MPELLRSGDHALNMCRSRLKKSCRGFRILDDNVDNSSKNGIRVRKGLQSNVKLRR